MRAVALPAIGLWIGSALVLSQLPWFRRRRLTDRIRPYAPAGLDEPAGGVLSVDSFRAVIGPVARDVGRRATRLLGAADDLDRRLVDLGSTLDGTAFRVRQIGWSVAAAGVGAAVTVAASLPSPAALLFIVGSPALAFLAIEDHLSRRWHARRECLELEQPVVAEQLAMLLSAGYSLGAALQRLSERSRGVCGSELARVCSRIRQGLTEVEALREWSARASVDALDRLVTVLALHHEGGDLSRLVSDEARTSRAEAQRRTVALIERRAQQVWIPVTVATLLPGVIFIAIPFMEAMRLFAGT